MSAFSAPLVNPKLDNSNLEQLKQEAAAFEREKNLDESLAKYDEALALQQSTIGEDHADTIETKYCIQRVIEKKINSGKAGSSFEDIAQTAGDLLVEGRFDESLLLYEQCLERMKKTRGVDHPKTLKTMNNMASALMQANRLVESSELTEKVLAIKSRVYGDEHPESLITLRDIGLVMTKQDRHVEARELTRKTFEIQ